MSEYSYLLENKWGKIDSICYSDLFESLALEATDEIFLIHYDSSGTKKEISHKQFWMDCRLVAASLANILASNQIVATVDNNRWQHCIVLIASLWARGEVAVLNPNDPPEEILQKAELLPKHILLNAPALDTIFAKLDRKNCHFQPVDSKYSIYVFTSGSTGRSKVVQQTKKGLLSNAFALFEAHNLTTNSIIATPLPVFHVNALCFALFTSLVAKSRLILYEKIYPNILHKSLITDKPTIFSCNPPILRLIDDFNFPKASLESIQYFLTAATGLPPSLAKSLYKKYGIKILQGYGLSECTNFSTLTHPNISHEEYLDACFSEPRPSIGSALKGNRIEIRNNNALECLEGEVGEICISGDTLMSRYLNAAQLPPSSIFATGDLGFYRSINNKKYFFHAGRTKDVCKIFGQTIGLADMDDLLADYFKSSNAITIAIATNTYLEEELVICLNFELYKLINFSNLSEKFLFKLPQACIPKKVFITYSPLRNSSGKPFRWQVAQAFSRAKKINEIDYWEIFSD